MKSFTLRLSVCRKCLDVLIFNCHVKVVFIVFMLLFVRISNHQTNISALDSFNLSLNKTTANNPKWKKTFPSRACKAKIMLWWRSRLRALFYIRMPYENIVIVFSLFWKPKTNIPPMKSNLLEHLFFQLSSFMIVIYVDKIILV